MDFPWFIGVGENRSSGEEVSFTLRYSRITDRLNKRIGVRPGRKMKNLFEPGIYVGISIIIRALISAIRFSLFVSSPYVETTAHTDE